MSRWLSCWLVLLFVSSLDAATPNVVVILADDMGCGDLSCYNKASKIVTPHLDRIASQGMRFTDAHSPSGVCTPTRYGLLTGRYAWRTKMKQGVLQGYDPLLIEKDRLTVAALLKKKGYATHCVGKWHLGLGDVKPTDYDKSLKPGPLSVGFDSFFGIPASLDMTPYVFIRDEACVAKPTEMIESSEMRRKGGNGFWRGGPIAPGFKHEDVLPKLTEEAVQIIQRHARQKKERGLFLYLPLASPHTPWMPTKEWQGKSKVSWYGDFVLQTDDAIGQVAKTLKDAGLEDNTLLIVTSDNGAHWLPEDIKKFEHESANGRRGQKSDIWEGGHRVPFLARWPGKVKAGTTSDELICLIDLLATCAELVGEKLPEDAGEDSESILPVLLGKEIDRPIRAALVHHSGGGTFGIRQGPWKLVEGLGSGGFSLPRTEKPNSNGPTGQLYNLAKDPAERENLYLKEKEIVDRLGSLLAKYRKEKHSVRRTDR